MAKVDRVELLRKIQEVEFAALDFNLYLDTHPDDCDALAEYNRFVCEAQKLRKVYCSHYGPLVNFGFDPSFHPWEWIEGPWPWENDC